MCLAVPARVERIQGEAALVNIGGVEREASLALVPDARVGEYVLLHAGFAIQVVDAAEAAATLRLLQELAVAGNPADCGEGDPEDRPDSELGTRKPDREPEASREAR